MVRRRGRLFGAYLVLGGAGADPVAAGCGGRVLLAFFHDAAIEWLNGPDIVRVEFGESVDLLLGDFDWGLQDEPSDGFVARRSGERSCVGVIREIARQERGGIELDSGNFVLVAFCHWHMIPELLDGGVGS